MILLLCLAVGAALVIWVSGRLRELEDKNAEQQRQIAALTARVFRLEGGETVGPPVMPAVAAPHPTVAPPPVPPTIAPPPVPPPIAPAPAMAPAPERMEPVLPAPLPPPVPAAAAQDLEEMIGGNWLSKLGVLMLLIGLALFIGFSLTEMGPLGRVLTGAATSIGLLGAGVAAERKSNYRVLGSALIGGGWAGLYFTTFAAHGIAEARVIESPGVGFFLLLAVAAGMILHSLRYESQTVTGLAYMAAFLTIAISSLTLFSAVASVPLLLSLLAVAWKFGWQPLAAAGAMFAYAAYGFDLATGDKDRYFVLIGEPVLWTYWVLLEGFDLAAKRRGAGLPIAPFNLTGFLLATAAVWPQGNGWQPGWMLGSMAVAQLLSAILRGRRNEAGELVDDSVFGGYRASITASAVFSAAFIVDHFTGLARGFTLALLAESVAVSGWLFRSGYLRGLGAALFVLPVVFSAAHFHPPLYWALSALFVVNRLWLGGGPWYSGGAVLTLGAVLLDFEPKHARPALLTIAAGALGLALRWAGKAEGRLAGLALAVLSAVVLVAKMPAELVWVTIGVPALLYGAFAWAIPEGGARLTTFVLMQFYAGALLYRVIGQDPWLMAAWAGFAAASWIAGLRAPAPSLAGSALLLELVAVALWAGDLLGKQDGLAGQLTAIAALFAMAFVPARGGDGLTRFAGMAHGALATGVLTLLLQDFVSGRRLTVAWGAEAFVLLGVGIGLQRRPLRLGGLALFALCLVKLFFYDFSQLDTLSRILSFIVLGCLLLAASWAYSRFREQIHRYL